MDYTDLNEYMGAFEGALSVRTPILKPDLRSVLLAVDGTAQDATAIALAAICAQRLGAIVHVTAGALRGFGPDEHARAEQTVELLRTQYGLQASTLMVDGKTPAKQLLAAATAESVGLIVMPAPYLQELDDLADESLSSPVDVLLAEAKAAILLVRAPQEDPAACFRRLVLPLKRAPSPKSAGWMLALAEPRGLMEMYSFAPVRAEVEEGATLTTERAIELLARDGHKAAGGMIAAAQKRASEIGAEMVFSYEDPPALPFLLKKVHERPCLTILSAPADRTSDAFHFVQDLTLGSRHPVLVVRD